MMAHIVNREQYEIWNGADGEHWAAHHDRYDAMAEGFDRHLFAAAALTETSHVLDIGCGAGQTTRLAARRSHRGHVIGVDLSELMLQRARRLAAEEGIGNVSFIRADAQVHSFTRKRFEVAISRAGVMDFADPGAAFANIFRAIRPGGRFVFVAHREASRPFRAIYEAVAEHVDSVDDVTASGVTLFADPRQVKQILREAGFAEAAATPADIVSVVGRDARDATDFLLDGPLRLMLRHVDAASRRRARAAVLETLCASETDGGVRLPAHGWLYTATKPERNLGDPERLGQECVEPTIPADRT